MLLRRYWRRSANGITRNRGARHSSRGGAADGRESLCDIPGHLAGIVPLQSRDGRLDEWDRNQLMRIMRCIQAAQRVLQQPGLLSLVGGVLRLSQEASRLVHKVGLRRSEPGRPSENGRNQKEAQGAFDFCWFCAASHNRR